MPNPQSNKLRRPESHARREIARLGFVDGVGDRVMHRGIGGFVLEHDQIRNPFSHERGVVRSGKSRMFYRRDAEVSEGSHQLSYLIVEIRSSH